MAYIDKEQLLELVTKEHVFEIFEKLGIDDYKTGSHGELILSTEYCHGGDSRKLYYYHEPTAKYSGKNFHCYTCGDSYNLIEFVLRVKRRKSGNPTYYQALQFIASIVGKGDVSQFAINKEDKIHDWNWLNRLKSVRRTKEGIPILAPIDETILEMFAYYPHEMFLNDNISRETMELYEIGYWSKTNQIVLPHRGFNGDLWGIRGRYIDDEMVRDVGKYVPLYIENRFLAHDLGQNLYGIHLNQQKIQTCKKVMLVEGEKGVMQNHTYFGEDNFALAVCGNNISSTQVRMLLQYLKVNEVIIAFDRMYEDADSYDATIYYNRLVMKAADLIPYCKVSLLLDKKDRIPFKASPTDMGKEVLLELLDEKIPVTTQELSRVLEETRKL